MVLPDCYTGFVEYFTLNTGAKIPKVGLGTWKAEPGVVGAALEYALLEAGYQHVDGAAVYGNEPEVGEAYEKVFKSGKVKREDVFITSKLWNSAHRKDRVRAACEETLRDLRLEYLDLYLMHWGIATPYPETEAIARKDNWDYDNKGYQLFDKIPIRETWEAMEELVGAGLVRAIGVSNFTVPLLIDLLAYAKVPPAMNQVELHPYLQQSRLVEFCQYRGIAVTAYAPLGSPGNYARKGHPLLADPVIGKIAGAYGKTPAQVLVRWAVERGTVAIPKSTHPERLNENIDVFDFALSPKDREAIAELEQNFRFIDPYEWGKVPYFD
jgi:diketogulonate reductase-like aldo/keto reductase